MRKGNILLLIFLVLCGIVWVMLWYRRSSAGVQVAGEMDAGATSGALLSGDTMVVGTGGTGEVGANVLFQGTGRIDTVTGIVGEQLGDFDGKYQLNQPVVDGLATQGCKERITEGKTTSVRRYTCASETNPEYAGGELVFGGEQSNVEYFVKVQDGKKLPEVVVFHHVDTAAGLFAIIEKLRSGTKLNGYCVMKRTTDVPSLSTLFVVEPSATFQSEIDSPSPAGASVQLSNGADPLYPCGIATKLWQASPDTYIFVRDQKVGGEAPGLYLDVEGITYLR